MVHSSSYFKIIIIQFFKNIYNSIFDVFQEPAGFLARLVEMNYDRPSTLLIVASDSIGIIFDKFIDLLCGR